EVMQDVAFGVAPFSRAEAEHLVRRIKGFPLLQGIRGQPPVDVPALVEVVERIGHLAVEFPEIVELDVNPLICYPDRVVAVDLRLTIAGEDG
ncbi:acetate--CoA ligase family protein, partial [Candidatus Bipolaricaulota bacterium]|nr:acetate--CoA ligase family protein [Candidatus Bipolaricaulota bacterium]